MDVLNGRSNPLVMRLSTSLATLLATLAPAWLCAQQLTVALVAPEFNGHHVDCFGHRTGSIDATVSGGTQPYQYKWSNGATTEDLAHLRAGYYKLTVMDADSVQVTAEITLTEPGALTVVADPYIYPNKHNVSCHDCYNGSITVEVDGGVAPYTYLWSDNATTKDRSGLGAMSLQLIVTDGNGCAARSDRMQLTQPGRESWDMTGNTGTDPNAHYIGTADTADMVFRTHGVERMRLLGDGGIKLPSAGPDDVGFIMKGGDGGLYTGYASKPWCFPDNPDFTPWYLCGNEVATNGVHFLGTVNEQPLNFRTNGRHRMVITAAGKVGIGSAAPADQFEVHTAMERGGITLVNTRTDDNAHTEIRFSKNSNGRWALGCDFQADGGQDFFLWDDQATARRLLVNAAGHLAVGNMAPEQALHVQRSGAVQSLVASSDAASAASWVRNSLFGYGLAVDADGRGHILYDHNSPASAISIGTNGKVGIGVDPPGSASFYQLYVANGIATRDVKVTAGNWPDFVFADGYRLMPLSELRAYLKRHRHLPGIPSAMEVERNEGVELGDMQARLLKVLEEQALYILHLEERIKSLEERRN
jgi:hypothetical protein